MNHLNRIRRSHFTPLALALMAILAMVFAGGCANPAQTAITTRAGYNTALSAIVTARQTGKIDDAQFARIDPLVKEGAAACDRLDAVALRYLDGDLAAKFDFAFARGEAERALAKLLEWQLRVQAKK